MSFVAALNTESQMQDFQNISGGKYVRGSAAYSILNPATLEIVGRAPLSTASDLDDAVISATAALKERWSTDEGLRRVALATCADILERHIDELSRLLSLEQGKPVISAAGEIRIASRICRYYSERKIEPEMIRETAADRIAVLRAPVGVVGLIVPWNFPITILFMKLGPALWSGNTLVIKPAPTTPLTTLRLVDLLGAALPAGVLNTVTGDGDIGEALVTHPGIAKISFTGSTATGRGVMRAAASTLKRLTLELGGNDAAIVLEDADPDVVAPRLFASAFTNAGQLCAAVKRLYVHQRIYLRVVENLRELARATKVGVGTAATTQMGPVNNRMQYDRIRGLVNEARAEGGTVFDGGEALPALPGYFLRPAIVTGLGESARLVVEEQFGPVLPVLLFADTDSAIAQANNSEFGLGASVWSRDEQRAIDVATQLEAGSLYVNSHAVPPDPQVPFGGTKSSGFGYELGDWGIDEFSIRRVMRVEFAAEAKS
jgi:acyl-CoA reductase-like NAD-dependent aldehyde dehydrogenase